MEMGDQSSWYRLKTNMDRILAIENIRLGYETKQANMLKMKLSCSQTMGQMKYRVARLKIFWQLWILDLVNPHKSVVAAIDFSLFIYFVSDVESEIDSCWHKLRQYQPDGPLVNTEFYPGWLTHWQEPFSRVNASPVVDSLR